MNDLFSEQADYYSRYRPVYPEELYDFILKHLEEKRYAWDCGTGSGQVAVYLSDYFQKVCASDISSRQMEHAERKDNIEYHNVQAEDSGFPSDYFNLITVAQAIHWFDFDRFYEEARRTAAEGALLAVFGYGRIAINPEVDPVIHQFYEDVFSKDFNEIRNYINSQYRTIPFPFPEISSPSFEINLEWTANDLEGFFYSWSAVQKLKTHEKINPVPEIMGKIIGKLTSGNSFEVKFPVFLRLGKIE